MPVSTKPTAVDMQNLEKEFLKNLPGQFSLDPRHTKKIGAFEVPQIQNGDWILNDHPLSLVQSFSARTNCATSIFVKIGNDFVRASTSLKKADNTSSLGTILEHNTPAYKNLIEGKQYIGKIVLNGKEHMSNYNVFRDKNGQVIGAYAFAIPL